MHPQHEKQYAIDVIRDDFVDQFTPCTHPPKLYSRICKAEGPLQVEYRWTNSILPLHLGHSTVIRRQQQAGQTKTGLKTNLIYIIIPSVNTTILLSGYPLPRNRSRALDERGSSLTESKGLVAGQRMGTSGSGHNPNGDK